MPAKAGIDAVMLFAASGVDYRLRGNDVDASRRDARRRGVFFLHLCSSVANVLSSVVGFHLSMESVFIRVPLLSR